MAGSELNEDEIINWNHFVIEQNGSFLQSYEWGGFQKSIGREVFFLRDVNWQSLVVKYKMPLGRNYLFCPHGPVLASDIKTCGFLESLQDLAQKEKSVFLRVEPCLNCTKDDLDILCFEKSKDIQPHKTLVLDLSLSEEELLAQMGEKTRYNIGLAARKGVSIKLSSSQDDNFEKDFEEFWDLLNQTARRQKIRLFGKEYYRKELQIGKNLPQPLLKEGNRSSPLGEVGRDFVNVLFIAEYQNKPIAANIVNLFGNRATYLHGGSDNEYRSLMAPHLLQWEQIKYAKSVGCKIYDFWGCDDEKWPGVSRFKKGYGGREVEFCGTHDYVFDKWWYRIYKAGRSILR